MYLGDPSSSFSRLFVRRACLLCMPSRIRFWIVFCRVWTWQRSGDEDKGQTARIGSPRPLPCYEKSSLRILPALHFLAPMKKSNGTVCAIKQPSAVLSFCSARSAEADLPSPLPAKFQVLCSVNESRQHSLEKERRPDFCESNLLFINGSEARHCFF